MPDAIVRNPDPQALRMDFTFDADQLALRDAIRKLLLIEAAPEMLREIWETEDGRSQQLRAKFAEQGLTALSVPEAYGGMALGDVDWALIQVELGYFGIPDSLSDTAYVAADLLASLPEGQPLKDEWLPRIAAGEARIAVGHPVQPLVADARMADLLLLAHGDELHAVARGGCRLEANPSIDRSRRLFRIDWTPDDQTRICDAADGAELWARCFERGSLASAGQLLGLAQRMLDLGVDYAAQRKQFGKAIGTFQAIKHHLADVAVKIEFAKPVLYRAAHALARNDPRAAVSVSHAKLACGDAAHFAAKRSLQVHGAIGYTWEADLQMFMKRAWALDAAWGGRGRHKARIDAFVLADGTALGPGTTFG